MKTLYQISTLKCLSNLSENFAHTAVVTVAFAIVTLSVELILGLILDFGNRVCAHATWLNVGTDRGAATEIPFSLGNENKINTSSGKPFQLIIILTSSLEFVFTFRFFILNFEFKFCLRHLIVQVCSIETIVPRSGSPARNDVVPLSFQFLKCKNNL